MANCQNNMRYGRQMNYNNCRSMPNGNNNCRPAPMPRTDRQCGEPEPCGCRAPEPRKPEPCGCRTPEPRKPEQCGCRTPEPRKPEQCGCRTPEPCGHHPEHHKPEPCECRTPERRPSQPCGCRYDALEDFPIAMAYVPRQKWRNLYEPCKGFQRGTIFEDLSKPFHGRGGCNR